ncbi:hypothetical protein [Campylobacter gracilis]|uniref:Uncharacterized protein n=1 Tax=Campylobacter gracilis RM3268 TaxID=553220 RepID=C8PEI2_9BACT|nr:hypothetical protein [Campylobacter gracilis]EEV18777.1 hypothetical protein CAMGR0001_1883 [Campylobacter gracilis RM3268]UEB45841.1 hypothetical protein LK410_01735 [Campylobacter gracilis]
MQSHDKIALKFYTKQANAKSANFLQNLRRNFTAKSSFKAVQDPPKECQKTKKSPPQNPRDEISPANFSQ